MNTLEISELFRSISPSEKYYDEMQEAATTLCQQQAEIDRLKFRIENSESLLEWENAGLERQVQLFEDALHNAQEKIEALEDDKVLHDEAYLSQMKEIEILKEAVELGLYALDNHNGNYKLTKKECDEMGVITEKMIEVLK